MLAPALLLCGVFIFVPAVAHHHRLVLHLRADLAELESGPGSTTTRRPRNDPIFWLSLRNNVIIVFGSIVLQVGIGTLLAAILDRGMPTRLDLLPHHHLHADGGLGGRRRR